VSEEGAAGSAPRAAAGDRSGARLDGELAGRVALVTGGSRGIGRATVRELAARGVRVAFTYNRSEGHARSLEAELPGRAIALHADAADLARLPGLRDDVHERLGRLDLLVNNAGVIADWDEALAVNLRAVAETTAAFREDLTAAGGRVVNVTSTYGLTGEAAILAYSAAKAGVVAVTRALAKELAPRVLVNAVAPGNVDTDMTRAAGAEVTEFVVSRTPLERLGEAGEVARVIRFLCSPDSAFVTGQTIVVDGGFTLDGA
jgi:NAD(P)-dependent dehydrogenase (short-subunit alcohol dehydrogenase family)